MKTRVKLIKENTRRWGTNAYWESTFYCPQVKFKWYMPWYNLNTWTNCNGQKWVTYGFKEDPYKSHTLSGAHSLIDRFIEEYESYKKVGFKLNNL